MPTPFPATVSGCIFGFRADELSGNDLDPVASITNLVGGGAIVLTQDTESKRPTLHTNEINGKKAVYFDGGDYVINTGAEAAVSANAITIIAVVKPVTSFSSYPGMAHFGASSGGRLFRFSNAGCPQFLKAGLAVNGTATNAVALGDWHVLTVTWNDSGTAYAFKTDRDANGSGSTGSACVDGNGMALGIDIGYPGNALIGYLAELWFYDHVLSEEDWDTVVTDIMEFYGWEEPTAPNPPENIQATPGDGENTLTWDAALGASSYNIYWDTETGVTKETGTKITDVESPYVHTGLDNEQPYYYVITAENDVGESDESDEVTATPYYPPVPATISGCLFGFRADLLPGSDLDPISSVTNLINDGAIVLSQSTESMKPTLHLDEINGKKAVYFDGGDLLSNMAAEAAVSANAVTIVAVVKPVTSFASYPTVCLFGPAVGGRLIRFETAGKPQFLKADVSVNGTATNAVALGDWHVLTVTWNDSGTAYAFKTDRDANGSGSGGIAVGDGNGMVLGSSTLGSYLTGYLAELWFYDHVLSEEDWDTVVTDIMEFYGWEEPGPPPAASGGMFLVL